MTNTMREGVACINSGQPLRYFALTTDDSARQLVQDQGLTEEAIDAMMQDLDAMLEELGEETPLLDESDYYAITAIEEARHLPDGRVGALIETRANQMT